MALAEHVRVGLSRAAGSLLALEAGRSFQERWLEDAVVAALDAELPEATVLARRRRPGFEVPGWRPQPGAIDVTVMRGDAPWCLLELKIDDVQHSIWDILKLASARTLEESLLFAGSSGRRENAATPSWPLSPSRRDVRQDGRPHREEFEAAPPPLARSRRLRAAAR